jgi:hypothetical protein
MSYYVFEGKNDYIAVYPALIASFKASGSISAGKGLAFDAGNTSYVYQPTLAVASGTACAGISLNAAADTKACSVLVWGFAKNLSAVAAYTPQPGDIIQLSGSGNFTSLATGSFLTSPYAAAGKVVSGSGAGAAFMAFISCMK